MRFISTVGKYLRHLRFALVICVLTAPVTAQERGTIDSDVEGLACGYAMEQSWDNFLAYAERSDIEVGLLLDQVVCRMALTTASPYNGNVWEASARYSGFVGDFIKNSIRYSLKDNDKRALFIALVTGGNVPTNGRGGGVFYELNVAWENIPAKRPELLVAARMICLSIDRFSVQGLDDIRTNECMTPPFVFPPRGD